MLGATTTSDTKIRLSEQSINTVPALRATGRKMVGNEGMPSDSKTSIRKLLGAECKPAAADYVEVVNRSLSAHGSISAAPNVVHDSGKRA